jgi:hypothetical protein
MTDETRMTALNTSVGADDGRSLHVTISSIAAFRLNFKNYFGRR